MLLKINIYLIFVIEIVVKMKVLIKILCISFLGISTAISMDIPEDDFTDSTYHSLAELQNKASTSKIKFIHNLSEFTYSKMNNEVLEFFVKRGGLVDESFNPAPHVKVVGDFAIDTKSLLYRSRFGGVRLGQDIVTKQFLAFKPVLRIVNDVEACYSQEANWLRQFGRFRGIIDHFDEPDLSHVAMNLIDGLNFVEIGKRGLFGKINHHARYLIAYNLVKAFEDFKERSIKQCDRMDSNFMVSANFDAEIIDFEWLQRTDLEEMQEQESNRPKFFTSMISKIFLADSMGNISNNISDIKKYRQGTFEKLIEFIGNKAEEGCAFIYVDDIIKVLPNLS